MSGCGLLKTKQPGSAAEGGYHVERTESEQGLLSIVLLVLLQRNCNPKTSQNLKMIYQPSLTIWVSQKLFPTSPRNGGFPKIKGYFPISKEVNCKKKSEAEVAFLTSVNGY